MSTVQQWYSESDALTRDASPDYKQTSLASPVSVQTLLGKPVARTLIIVTGSGTVRLTTPKGDTRDLALTEGTVRGYQFTAIEAVSGTISLVEIAL